MAPKPPSIARALAGSLRTLTAASGDAAAVSLAKRYAAHLDRAAELEAEAAAVVQAAAAAGEPALVKRVAALEAAVSAQAVASDLGPKLLAVLAALTLTPASRRDVLKGSDPVVRPASPLERLRAERARLRGAAPVD